MTLTLLIALTATPASADEGMWLPSQVPAVAAAHPDLALDPAVLADPTGPVLGAVVSLGGCSGSFVSADGLIATNHHCVEGYLRHISDEANNRWRDGFTAASREDEPSAGPTARVYMVAALTDVTSQMTRRLSPRLSDAARAERLESAEKALIAGCEAKAPDRRCRVAAVDGGVSYLLVESRELRDLRVVWAPPRSVGQYGGDIDNWMWPRHGFDGALLRAYVAPDGASADFDAANVPFKPAHHLPLGPGVAEGDLVMSLGFPGRTARHRLASELAHDLDVSWPRSLEFFERWLPVIRAQATTSEDASSRLGPRISSFENRQKNLTGQTRGVLRADGVGRMRAQEDALLAWVRADEKRRRTWEPVWSALTASLEEAWAAGERWRPLNLVLYGSTLLRTAHDAIRWADERAKPDTSREPGFQDRDRDRYVASLRALERSLHLPTERALFTLELSRYAADHAGTVSSLDALLASHGSAEAAADALYGSTPALADVETRVALVDASARTVRASADPFLQLAALVEADLAPERAASKARGARIETLRAQWAQAEMAFAADTGALRAPDANSTLRISFAHVRGYDPEDGLIATPFTRLSGFAAKAGPAPFDAPAHLVAAAREGASSPWTVPSLGDVPLNFLADLDTTGGNSGSPVVDAQGRLVGLLFDGVWEGVANDVVYDDATNRSICLDLRALGWLLDHTEGAGWIREELGLTR